MQCILLAVSCRPSKSSVCDSFSSIGSKPAGTRSTTSKRKWSVSTKIGPTWFFYLHFHVNTNLWGSSNNLLQIIWRCDLDCNLIAVNRHVLYFPIIPTPAALWPKLLTQSVSPGKAVVTGCPLQRPGLGFKWWFVDAKEVTTKKHHSCATSLDPKLLDSVCLDVWKVFKDVFGS